MARPEDQKNLQADIDLSVHTAITDWADSHKGAALRHCVQAACEVWLRLPEPIQGITLVVSRHSDMFANVMDEVATRLLPMVDELGLLSRERRLPVTERKFVAALDEKMRGTGAERAGRKKATARHGT
jgi:hypothetical protein